MVSALQRRNDRVLGDNFGAHLANMRAPSRLHAIVEWHHLFIIAIAFLFYILMKAQIIFECRNSYAITLFLLW